MSETAGACEPDLRERGAAATLDAADCLSLAATPSFALMALLTTAQVGGPADALCPAAHDSLLGGMAPMYLLMSVFHCAPWATLIATRRMQRPE